MISTAYRFIFIHIPKTGGNSIQDALLPYSDDSKIVASVHGDGGDRFNIQGPVTPGKHATLEDYVETLGEEASAYRVMTVFRDPLERALSLYYSPSRLLRQGGADAFDIGVFKELLHRMKTAVSFITVRGQPVAPDFLMRFDTLAQDFRQATRALGLPHIALGRINVSGDTAGLRDGLRDNPEILALVRTKFAEDYAYFDSLATGS